MKKHKNKGKPKRGTMVKAQQQEAWWNNRSDRLVFVRSVLFDVRIPRRVVCMYYWFESYNSCLRVAIGSREEVGVGTDAFVSTFR